MMTLKKGALGLAMAAGIAGGAVAQESHDFAVVGTWGQLAHWMDRESVFWNETLPAASDGRLTATARPLTELGMDGTTVMRELRSGAFDFAHGVFLYVAADSPVIEGADLVGVTPDLATFRQVMDVYRPVLEGEFQRLFNSHILMLYAWPQTHLICNFPEDTPSEVDLSFFEDRHVRSFGASADEFITNSLGAVPVAVAFGEVLPSLERGALDCGATGVLSAYSGSWQQGTTHDLQVALGYTASFLAVNNDTWNALSDEDRALIEEQVALLEDQTWEATAREDAEGIACLSDGPCPRGEPGGLQQMTMTDAGREALRDSVETGVIGAWATRCEARSPGCAEAWNETIGALLGFEARP
ncbi:TRAP transporter substrate-binding protein DctP [Pararhodobacter marinus]|uniref:TRAP transporter substrate-binding protein DctP n=2 Tax=Pararhodobacter marinus TaxID=2184063 RepID=UPI003513EFAB